MADRTYTAHEVAVILADAFGDDCACNFNGNDEWLSYLCELQEACPHPCGVACWEQYLKYKDRKEEILQKYGFTLEANMVFTLDDTTATDDNIIKAWNRRCEL